jgi:hypothetical protein
VDGNDNPIPSFIIDVRPAESWPEVNETTEPWSHTWGFQSAFGHGQFALSDVPAGTCNVILRSHATSVKSSMMLTERIITVSAGQTVHLRFEIEDWETKRQEQHTYGFYHGVSGRKSMGGGRCTDANGRPVSNALVLIYEQDYAKHSVTLLTGSRTDAEGHFILNPVAQLSEKDLGRKTYIIFVPSNGHGPAWKRISSTPVGLELITHESAVVMGNVLTKDSKPIAGANVWIRDVFPPEATEDPKSLRNDFHSIAPVPGWSALTDRNGSFRITGVPEGARVGLVISHVDFAKRRVYVKPGKRVDIEVLPAAVITGRVVHEKTNLPAVGAIVEAQGIDQHAFVHTVTDEQGRYRLESLGADKYNVWARAEGLTTVALDSFKVEVGQIREAPDFRLVEGGFIIGRVVDEKTGNPVKPGAGSNVAIRGPSRPQSGAAVESSRIREDSSFRILVAPGRNYIHLRPGEGWRRQQAVVTPAYHWVTVKNGQTVQVEFKIRKLSEDEIERAKAARGKTTIIRHLPKTIDELEEQEIDTHVQVEVDKP